jgi:hypothetical protein
VPGEGRRRRIFKVISILSNVSVKQFYERSDIA